MVFVVLFQSSNDWYKAPAVTQCDVISVIIIANVKLGLDQSDSIIAHIDEPCRNERRMDRIARLPAIVMSRQALLQPV